MDIHDRRKKKHYGKKRFITILVDVRTVWRENCRVTKASEKNCYQILLKRTRCYTDPNNNCFGAFAMKLQSPYISVRLFGTTNYITCSLDGSIWFVYFDQMFKVCSIFIMQDFIRVCQDFVFSLVLYGKPMKLLQNWCYVIIARRSGNKTCRSILDVL